MALRMGEQARPARQRFAVRLGPERSGRITPARERVLALLADGKLRDKPQTAAQAGVSQP